MEEQADIKFTSKLCFVTGVTFPKPDFFKNLSKFSTLTWYLYVSLAEVIFVIQMISLAIEVYVSYDDLKTSIMALVALIYLIENLFKFFLFVMKNDEFSEVYRSLEFLCEEFSARKDGYAVIHKRYYEPIKKLGKMKPTFEFSSVAAYIIGVLIFSLFNDPDSRQIPIPAWTPFYPLHNPAYSFVSLFEGITFQAALLKNSAIDIVILTILLSSAAQLKYLNFSLEKIFRDNETQIKEDCGKKEEEYLWWLKTHREILRILDNFRPLCSYYLSIAYVAVLSDLFLAGIVVTSPDLDMDIYKVLVFMINIVVQTLQLYLVCLAADVLKDCGSAAAQNCLSSKLIFSSNSWRSSFTFVTVRSSKRIRFTAAGLCPLGSETFGEMIRLTVTYFFTIVQIRARYTGGEKGESEALPSLRNA